MTYQEALSYIHKTEWKGSRPGLERITQLLHLLGDPHKDLKFVHVAGTNGKGSVCVMLNAVLTSAGYRTGLFTSPFLFEFRERIRIGDALISEEDLVRAVEAVAPFADAMEDSPTEFELMTAIAFWYFKEQVCDVVVCEVGMGGELDSTNVIASPLLSVITTIALDHTRELGTTLSEIARAKAGIIKEGAPVLFAEAENKEALAVISDTAKERRAPLTLLDSSGLSVHGMTLDGSVLSFLQYENLKVSLVGAYQWKNTATVLQAVELLKTRGLSLPETAVYDALSHVRWQGRFEVISRSPVVVLDGAHNPHGARALLESLAHCFDKGTRFFALSAVMADKEYKTLFSTLAPHLSRVYCTAPQGHARALEAKKLAAVCGELGVEACAFDTVKEGALAAFRAAKQEGCVLLVFGSLYLYREAYSALTELLEDSR